MIALLCPTRARPQQFARMFRSARETSKLDNVSVWSASNGDDSYVPMQFPIDTPTVHMWNSLAIEAMHKTDAKLFMLAADDIIFETAGWDNALLEHYAKLDNKIHVYALQDSRDADGVPHVIATREYIQAVGYFLPPIFMHWNCDTWTVEIAKANNCFTHLRDYKLTHDKPSDTGKPDETHNHIRRMGWRERDASVNETCQHFLQCEKNRLALHMRAK